MKNERKVFIVVEGKTDAELIRKLLERIEESGRKHSAYQILPSSGFSSALSKTISLLIQNKGKVLLVLDTDSDNESEISNKKQFVNDWLGAHHYKDDLRTVWAEPNLERVLSAEFEPKLPGKTGQYTMANWGTGKARNLVQTIANFTIPELSDRSLTRAHSSNE